VTVRRVIALTTPILAACCFACTVPRQGVDDEQDRIGSVQQPLTTQYSCGDDGQGNVCVVTVTENPDGSIVYRIDRPIVTQPSTVYPGITFRPGDTVTVTAGGCAQSGGIGKTWHRYVDPSGPESDEKYHGWIQVPSSQYLGGGPYGGVWFSALPLPFTDTITTPEDPNCRLPSTLPLTLGFTDSQYDDNGYWSHDDGPDGQCELVGDAWVVLVVQPGVPGPWPWPVSCDFDLVPDCVDDNYNFEDPRWGWQIAPPGTPIDYPGSAGSICQTTTLDGIAYTPMTIACDSGYSGHRNWMPATYHGTVGWEERAWSDDDYNISLATAPVPGFPPQPPDEIRRGALAYQLVKLEFDSDETIDQFNDSLGDESSWWWGRFQKAVDDSKSKAQALIDGHEAVVIGLMGVDEVHSGAELHPTFVLAMRTAAFYPEPCAPDLLIDHWSLFVRNIGNEGYCSSHDWYLSRSDIVVEFPPSNPSLLDQNAEPWLYASNLIMTDDAPSTSQVHPANGLNMKMSFHLPDPSTRPWVVGEVDFAWQMSGSGPPCSAAPPPLPPSSPSPPPPSPDSPDDDEKDDLKPVLKLLTDAQYADFLSLLPLVRPERAKRVARTLTPTVTSLPPPLPARITEALAVPSPPRVFERRRAVEDAICVAANGAIPGLPGACATYPPLTILTATDGVAGKNGWVVTPETITLTARDASGSGIARTEQGLDGVSWDQYGGPYLAPEGGGSAYYRSVDNLGNVEPPRHRPFKIDTHPPLAFAAATMSGGQVAFGYQVFDPLPGSGPAGAHLIYLGSGGPTATFAPGASGSLLLDTLCNDVEYWGEDVAGNEQAPHAHTPDTVPPALLVQPPTTCLWPPNHRIVRFALGKDITYSANDACDANPQVRILSVTSSEPDNGLGDGDTPMDMQFGPSTVCVRRERSAKGPGRVYRVLVEAMDYAHNATTQEVLINVPRSHDSSCATGTEVDDFASCH
jgi:hypothetical protein